MYCARMKCHINFDPGGKNPLLLVSVVLIMLIVGILQFGEVQCSTATGDERGQRRPEFPDTSHAQNSYGDRSTAAPSGSTSKFNISGQTNLLNDDVLRFKPDEFTGHSEEQAKTSLSALINIWRKLLNKSLTNDLAADKPLHKNEFIHENQRTKSIHVEDEMKELKLRGREEEPESLIEKKPFSIHKNDIQEGDDSSRSHQSGGSISNVGTDEHRHLVKREAGKNEPENGTLTTENLPATNPQGDTNASVKDTPSESDKQTDSKTVGTLPKSTSSSRTQTTVPGTTTQKPQTSLPSISTTVQQVITTLSQKTSSRTSPTVPLQERPTPTTSKRETVKSHTSQIHVQGTEASPKTTTSKKETVKAHTSRIQGTEESPTTDAAVIEESNASCDGVQCYASRLPYHWTSDASWALASMVFLLSILTFFVLYTGLWKKRNPMSFPLDSSLPPDPNPRINIAELLKTRLAMIPKHLRGKRQMHRKRMNGRRYEELPLHQSNGTCNDEELDYFEDDEEDDLYLRD
ncbi:uncharacterized protein LOC755835 isoform X2 [Strongylocentrotus purpuratus]|uniref:Uncharacterized protein n=1 Tax=Strongylocentrotus purpuratus TaxID=7668 RepID=A0A7M7LTA2_STRPU|nr:uncharacterized protein LOC755835 isoform X2 [Strongylocentrotus purpuratus]